MGLTPLTVEIANAAKPSRRVRVKMLVDSGAAYSIIDASTGGIHELRGLTGV